MAVIVREHRKASCAFKSVCNHAPAEWLYIHEFVNRPQKPLCNEHKRRIEAFQNRKPVKA